MHGANESERGRHEGAPFTLTPARRVPPPAPQICSETCVRHVTSAKPRTDSMTRSAVFLFAVGLPVLAAASDTDSRIAPACGPNNVAFSVRTSKTAPQAPAADANSAMVYVIQDDSEYQNFPHPTVRTGL